MNKNILDKFRRVLTGRRDSLVAWMDTNSAGKEIRLGGVSVQEVEKEVCEHNKVIDRIDSGAFGICTECREEVETERLELDFTTCVCLDCYSDSQKRLLERDLELAAKEFAGEFHDDVTLVVIKGR